MSVKFKDPNSEANKTYQRLFLGVSVLINKLPFFRNLFINFGFCQSNLTANFRTHFNTKPKLFHDRESLWQFLLEQENSVELSVLEFGVAWGYCTNYFLSRPSNIQSWHGFDSFEGLPEDWRHYQKGHFSNNGNPPNISDVRLHWHIGLVEDTFNYKDNIYRIHNSTLLIILDMDLFFPTYFVLSEIAPHLSAGDLLYFDEPHDFDEFSIVHFLLKLNPMKIEVIGATPCQLVMRVKENGIIFPGYIRNHTH